MNRKTTDDLILYCEYTTTPLGVETPSTRFGWQGTGALREELQKAYRIRV